MSALGLGRLLDAGARVCLLGHALTVGAAVLTLAYVFATGSGDAAAVVRVAGATGLVLGMPGVGMVMVRDAVLPEGT